MIIACGSLTGSILHFSQAVVNNSSSTSIDKEQVQDDDGAEKDQAPKDIITQIFNSQITTMILSTFIIAIVGVVINKFRSFKKRFDMVEIVVKAQAKMKKQADEREQKLEERLLKFEARYGKFEEKYDRKLGEIHARINDTDNKIDNVKDEATSSLINFLSRKKD